MEEDWRRALAAYAAFESNCSALEKAVSCSNTVEEAKVRMAAVFKIRAIETERDGALSVIDRQISALEGELAAIFSAEDSDG